MQNIMTDIGSVQTGYEKMAEAEAWVMIPKVKNKGTECVIDMRPIVLCKNCKHWDEEEKNCNIKIGWFYCDADWFCADGERRTDDA